ncbi:hypothetical protein ACN4FV_11065, partial [Aliarcobacter butzleri]
MVTPAHICPEWCCLWTYVVVRGFSF